MSRGLSECSALNLLFFISNNKKADLLRKQTKAVLSLTKNDRYDLDVKFASEIRLLLICEFVGASIFVQNSFLSSRTFLMDFHEEEKKSLLNPFCILIVLQPP
jgi:hypothetical protein